MAAMSVIGIDFGNDSCYVAVAKAGGIETIANDYSLRSTPSFIAFAEKNRILGVAAKNQQVTNMKNTVYNFKRLLGRHWDDPEAQKELSALPFQTAKLDNGKIGIKVNYLNEEFMFTPEQCTGMLLTKLKEISATALQTQINDCVISVPSYFTNAERKALLDAASISGLNVLRLMNETTATALAYGIYKQDLPAADEKPRNIVFVDCGQSALQVSVVAFNMGKLRMLATTADRNCGGRDIDHALAEYFVKDFLSRYKIDAHKNARAYTRLLAEVEKLKKNMSANSTPLPLGIECFMEEKDVHGTLKRSDMEQLCANFFQKVERTLIRCFQQSKLKLDEIHSVEIVGGSTRIPAIKQLIEKVFHRTPCTSLNQDEAVSRGCALQCAILSPAVRVREFSVTDVQMYPIKVCWDTTLGEEGDNELEVFPENHAIPFSKLLTFYRREPFVLRGVYASNDIPYPTKDIGQWIIKDIKPTAEGESQKLKVKVRVNLHGIFNVSSALLMEKKETIEEAQAPNDTPAAPEASENGEAKEGSDGTNAAGQDDVPMTEEVSEDDSRVATDEDGTNKSWTQRLTTWFKPDDKKKKKQTVKQIELPIEAHTHGCTLSELNDLVELELKMISSDRQEKERADSRNALEEYVYELRDKLSGGGDLHEFVLESDGSKIIQQLADVENWLYDEEGETCTRQIYTDKLQTLKKLGEPIQQRRLEFDLRPQALEDLAGYIQITNKAIEQIHANDPKFAHLTPEEVNTVSQAVQKAAESLENIRRQLVIAPKYQAPPILVSQIREEREKLDAIVRPILRKPAPKAPSPPKEKPEEAGDQDAQSNGPNANGQNGPQDKMDVE